ncbi:hypothetical protein ACFTQ7_12780 [Lysinibacillus sp. NPDC056959]|uniref:hypothetical protein n=1 Tax=Lysinibacillus sp. NPDC056959 TaxID=3345981 RepID=UPI00363B68E0
MDNYIMEFHLDNGDQVSTPEIKADSYQMVYEKYFNVDDKTRMVIIEKDAETIFFPSSKVSKINIINLTAAEKDVIDNWI